MGPNHRHTGGRDLNTANHTTAHITSPTGLLNPQLGVPGLETVYDTLATAIDQAGPDASERFLVKLALLCANELGSAERFAALVAAAQRDLA